ncbi:MAG: thrombospondin type 3 repeat-containing protein [Phycisphaerales bacterium]|nr:thrombospondin type 3 repeat-containing protein [Phycisphaerales bacterium]
MKGPFMLICQRNRLTREAKSGPKTLCVLLSAVVLVGATRPGFGIAPLRKVVVTGEQAPGMPQGVVFDELGRPDINAEGYTVFSAVFSGPGVTQTNDNTLWSDRSGSPVQEAREGQQALGLPLFVVYKTFGTPILNDEGRIAFEASLSGVGVTFENDEGIWSEGATGVLGLIAREGNHAAGTPANVNHNGIFPPLFNNSGRVLFGGALKGPGVDFTNNAAFWSGFPGSVALVIREAEQAPGLPPTIKLKYGSVDIGAVLGGTNQCAFRAGLDGAVSTNNDNAIYAGTVSIPALLIREGEQAPGAPAGVNIGNVLQPTINASGATAFLTFLAGGAVDPSNDTAIFSEGSSGMLDLVARKGGQAPGAAQGTVFDHLQLPLLSANGSTAFAGILAGPGVNDTNNECIYSDNIGTLAFVAREGDQAPGMEDGVVFAGDAVAMQPAFTGQMAMNSIGQIIFRARVDGPGVGASNNMGIWQHDPVAGLRLILRYGDGIDVAPGDTRIVQQIIFVSGSGGSDGRPCPLNDAGQFSFWAWFTDGSQGIFVTADTDDDGTVDIFDNCPLTLNPGQEDADGDGDGDACDGCPNDANKLAPGTCGCSVPDDDSDGDGVPNCLDDCPNDPDKRDAGPCGCGQSDIDSDGDLILDCFDNCPDVANSDQADADDDGIGDICDDTPTGQTSPEMQDCCGGGMPMMMPFVLAGWVSRRRRSSTGRIRG